MAHFAQIDENNMVLQVIVVHNNQLTDENGVEQEHLGVQFCQNLLGGNWKQTSYNGTARKNYAGVGYVYDAQRDAFIPPQPYPSWVLAEETCQWTAPVAMPTDDGVYLWDETTQTWAVE